MSATLAFDAGAPREPAGVGAPRARALRDLRLALVAGALLGTAHGVGGVIGLPVPWWKGFLSGFVPILVLALAMLPCLALAARVRGRGAPAWVAYVGAAVVATTAVAALEWSFLRYAGAGVRWPRDHYPWHIYAWSVAPIYLLPAVLAALAVMRARDAARRTQVLRRMQLEGTRAARRAYEARLHALQARIEPRFLFDTLSDVEALYESSPARAARALDDLIVYLHAVLPDADAPATTLAAELALARTWLSIMRARSGGRFDFSVAEPGRAASARMPPMVLVPLVKHAVESDAGGTFGPRFVTVTVDAAAEADRLRIGVTVASPALAPTAAAAVADPIRAHLRALYGDEASLALAAGDGGESRATLEVPLVRA